MKSHYLKLSVLFFCVLFFSFLWTSCSKDGEGSLNTKITYEITGNITVPVEIQYTPTTLDYTTPNEEEYQETATLPWKKEVELLPNVGGVGCSVSVDNAVPNQTVTLKIFREGKEVATTTDVVDADGYLSCLLNYYMDGKMQVVHD